jgi:hypothetical protein
MKNDNLRHVDALTLGVFGACGVTAPPVVAMEYPTVLHVGLAAELMLQQDQR